MCLQPFGQFKCVIYMALYTQRKRFQSLYIQPGIKRRLRWPEIAQAFNTCADDELNITKRPANAKYIGKYQTVVAFGRIGKLRVLAIAPVVIAAINYYPANAGTVPANPFCGRFNHHMGAML